MKNKIKKLIIKGLIGVSLLTGTVKAENKKTIRKPSITITRVQNEEQDPINRLEITGKLPYNFEYYGIAQEQEASDFYKGSVQWVPIRKKCLSGGLTAQYVNGNNFHASSHGSVYYC